MPKPPPLKSLTLHNSQGRRSLGELCPKTTEEFFSDLRDPPIRSSSIDMFDLCPRRFLYRCRMGISGKGYNRALTLGSFYHELLQALFIGASFSKAREAAGQKWDTNIQLLLEEAGEAGFLPGGTPIEKALSQMEEDFHKAVAMAGIFWEQNPFTPDDWEVLRDPDGNPMIEAQIKNKIPDIPSPIWSPLDLCLIRRGTTEVYVVDHKTTSLPPALRAKTNRLCPQIQLYRLNLQTALDRWHTASEDYPYYTVVGSIHNIIQKPGIKFCPATKDKAGFNSYLDRVRKWFVEKEENGTPGILQSIVKFTGPVLTEEFKGRLKQMSKACTCDPNLDAFYRVGEKACTTFNSVCPFLLLCVADPVMWPGLVRDNYRISFREDEEESNG